MRKSFIGGNWKMNGTHAEVRELIQGIIKVFPSHNDVESVVFPPFVFLQQVKELISNSALKMGAQNMSAAEKGAFTGEISANMLLELDCRYVLVGHSERRHLCGENNAVIAAKFLQASKHGLQPVLCVGETLEERETDVTKKIISSQIDAILALPEGIRHFKNAIIAYEPVWAIGTGVNATPEQAQVVHSFIRQLIKKYDENLANELRIIYGGSVKAANARELLSMPDIDGGLIGGASLNAKEFVEIIKACKH